MGSEHVSHALKLALGHVPARDEKGQRVTELDANRPTTHRPLVCHVLEVLQQTARRMPPNVRELSHHDGGLKNAIRITEKIHTNCKDPDRPKRPQEGFRHGLGISQKRNVTQKATGTDSTRFCWQHLIR